jgi:hypothetical protein
MNPVCAKSAIGIEWTFWIESAVARGALALEEVCAKLV